MKKEDWVLLAPVVATQCIAFYFAHRAAPSAYMDEIFHVPQAQQYCQGNFHGYDAQLTTPPGLYLVSAALHTLGVPCTLLFLRLQSLAIGLVILPALCSLLNPSSSQRKQHSSWLFAVMPLFSFFSLIYYTDLLSTSLVLATLVLLQRDWTVLASTVSLLFPAAS
jgi:alpha-1,2-glucosyltransferase